MNALDVEIVDYFRLIHSYEKEGEIRLISSHGRYLPVICCLVFLALVSHGCTNAAMHHPGTQEMSESSQSNQEWVENLPLDIMLVRVRLNTDGVIKYALVPSLNREPQLRDIIMLGKTAKTIDDLVLILQLLRPGTRIWLADPNMYRGSQGEALSVSEVSFERLKNEARDRSLPISIYGD